MIKLMLQLVRTDIKQIFRDKTLTFFMLMPICLLLFVRYGVPQIALQFPILQEYYYIIVMFASIQTAIMFGFNISFIILDEKDENVIQVIRVLPISASLFMLYRLVFATLYSFVGAFCIITFSGIVSISIINTILISIQYALAAPIITLLIATFANNKIEGIAYFKGIDLVLILPVMVFFLSSPFMHLFAIVPSYWTYRLFEKSMNHSQTFVFFIWGLLVHLSTILILFKIFKKKVF